MHIQNESDNFLLCGANCSERHATIIYAKKLTHHILHIQKQSYIIDGFNTTFTVELLPSDMKWLSTVAGELNNAAYYFSPFGNVNSDNKAITNGSLGEDPSCTWHPWDYEERIQVVKKVANKREQLSKTNYSSTNKRRKFH